MVDRRDILQFIFNSHLSLFNTRRDHEWRVMISAMILMGAVDATILTVKICLTVRQQDLWIFALVLLFFSIAWYQWGVQVRTRFDRIAMDPPGMRSSVPLPTPFAPASTETVAESLAPPLLPVVLRPGHVHARVTDHVRVLGAHRHEAHAFSGTLALAQLFHETHRLHHLLGAESLGMRGGIKLFDHGPVHHIHRQSSSKTLPNRQG